MNVSSYSGLLPRNKSILLHTDRWLIKCLLSSSLAGGDRRGKLVQRAGSAFGTVRYPNRNLIPEFPLQLRLVG